MSEAEPRPHGLALGLTLALLLLSNVVANEWLPKGWYVPWNLAVAVALVAATRLGGRSWRDLRLDRDDLGAGLRLGGLVGGAIAAAILLASVIPLTSGWFEDDIGNASGGELAMRVLVTIPLGTVVMEEIAFRGCLPALFAARGGWTARRAGIAASALFGLWHILPSRGLGDRNATMGSTFGDTLGQWAPIAAAVVATAVAGLALEWLAHRSRSVAAPMLVHYALNAAATLATAVAAT